LFARQQVWIVLVFRKTPRQQHKRFLKGERVMTLPGLWVSEDEHIQKDSKAQNLGRDIGAGPGKPALNLQGGGDMTSSSEIPALYSQIRELVARSANEPGLSSEIDRQIQRLRSLQEAQAEELERRFEERLRLRSGSGWAHLQRIKERLGDA